MSTPPTVQLYLLNRFKIAGVEDTLRSNKVRALLAYLAIETDQPHSRPTLAALLWSDLPDKRAGSNLRLALHSLRNQLRKISPVTDLLETTRRSVQLRPQSILQIDVTDFQQLLAEAEAAENVSDQQRLLQAGIDVYKGDLCRGLQVRGAILFEEWLLLKQEQLHQQAVTALQKLLRLLQAAGDGRSLRRYSQRLIELMPFYEGGYLAQMEAHGLMEDLAGVQAVFESYRTMLKAEFGEAPSETAVSALNRLQKKPTPLPKSTSNIPAAVTPFFGREKELHHLNTWLIERQYRLISLIGMGGIGKTRLALQLAHENKAHFSDGVWFVPLAGLESIQPHLLEAQIAEAIANIIGFKIQGNTPAKHQLTSWLQSKKLLLILDNWEQIIDGVGIVGEILKGTENVSILCTSQIMLDFQMERIFEVEGLPVPAPGDENAARFDSIRLFWERAERFVQLDDADLAQVIQLCQFMEGHPLAIELAAAALRKESLTTLLNQLAKSAAQLAVTFRDFPRRQRSIRALFDHAWVLLDTDEQAVMCRLAVMHGQFSPSSAAAVAQADEEMLFSLYDKSLLQRVSADHFALHGLLTHYALEKLQTHSDLWHDAVSAHTNFYLNWVSVTHTAMMRRDGVGIVQALKAEYDNIKAAWSTAVETGEFSLISITSVALSEFLAGQSRLHEGLRLFSQKLGGSTNAADEKARLIARGWQLCYQAYFLFQVGNMPSAELLFEQARKLAEKTEDQRLALRIAHHLCDFLISKNDLDVLDKQLDRAERLAREQEHDLILSLTWMYRASALSRHGLTEEAWSFLAKAQAIAEEHQLDSVMLEIYVWQLYVLKLMEKWDEYPALCQKAIALAREMDEQLFQLTTMISLAEYFGTYEQYAESLELLEPVIEQTKKIGHVQLALSARRQRGWVLLEMGQYDAALDDLIYSRDGYAKLERPGFSAMDGIGQIYIRTHRFDAAQIAYEQLLEIATRFDRAEYVQKAQMALAELKEM